MTVISWSLNADQLTILDGFSKLCRGKIYKASWLVCRTSV